MDIPKTVKPKYVAIEILDRLSFLARQSKDPSIPPQQRAMYLVSMLNLQAHVEGWLATGLDVAIRRDGRLECGDLRLQKFLDAMSLDRKDSTP